ncbi:MAG: CNNM domain-containing protein [Kiritimatiellia bacterium]
MISIPVIECAALFLLLFLSAFFSSAETALFSLNPIQVYRIRQSSPEAAGRLERMLSLPTDLLSSILIGNTLVNITAAALGFVIAERMWPSYGEAISIPAMTFLLLIFGEIAPKKLALSKPEWLSARYSAVLSALFTVTRPLRAMLGIMSGSLKKPRRARGDTLTEDEFLTMVEVGEEQGVLDREERSMVDGIIRLEETQASDIMTPRVDLTGIDIEDDIEEVERTATSVNYRYLPVYRESLDHVEGFLEVPRFLLARKRDVHAALIPPFFVPETAPLDTLLSSFQQQNKRVAFVVDEYGGTAGLITRGDILEEIARDVDNEYREQEPAIQPVGPDRWLVEGSTSLEDINYELDMNLEAEGADRISGWVTAMAEHIPAPREVVEARGCRAVVQRVRHNRISLVTLEKIEEKKDGEEEETE